MARAYQEFLVKFSIADCLMPVMHAIMLARSDAKNLFVVDKEIQG